MNAPAFTPGPWVIGDPNCRLDGTREKGIHAGDYVIADMNADAGADAQQAANARLIATAPELYEAAAAVAALYADEPEDELDPAWGALRAALAKAVQS